jgi:hypothetical protein
VALRSYRGDEIRASFLGCDPHLEIINERPVAKAIFIEGRCSGA